MILVTGGAGFIGSHLVHRLSEAGFSVRVLDVFLDSADDSAARHRANVANFPKGVEFIQGDIREHHAVDQSLKGVSTLFHLAGLAGVHASTRDPQPYWDTNVAATDLLLRGCEKYGVPRVLLASSSSVYGEAVRPTPEHAALNPQSPYAATKIEAERLVAEWSQKTGNIGIRLRPFTVYGPRQRPTMVVSRFAAAAREARPFPIFGDGSITRDHTHVFDVIDACMAALNYPRSGVFNVGAGHSSTLLELGTAIARVHGTNPSFEFLPLQPGDAQHTLADLSLVRQELGWSPRFSLEEGLRQTFQGR